MTTIAPPRTPARVIHWRRSGNTVLAAIADTDGALRLLRIASPDDGRLYLLSDFDRALIGSALCTIATEAGNVA